MANNENLIPIPGRLHSVATEGHVSGADEIYDDTQQKDQATINSELISAVGTGGSVDSKIATAKTEIIGDAATDYNTLGKLEDKIQAEVSRAEGAESALDGRVDTLEDAVGTGGSVDSRISAAVATETTRAQAAEADRYTKSETYNKTELNNMITTPNQEYVSVTATAQTTAVTDVLPATGAADTTYRVGNWDGTQYNDSVFSEYAWDGSAYIKLSTKSQVGEVYDISVNHADTKYADLAAALGTNGANIPQSLRKGGMSVKFVQSSDNKYVQYRYMESDAATFTNVANWQSENVDSEPTGWSRNLVESWGSKNYTDRCFLPFIPEEYQNIKLNSDGTTSNNPGTMITTEYIPVTSGHSLEVSSGVKDSNLQLIAYDASKVRKDNFGITNGKRSGITVASNVAFVRFTFSMSGIGAAYLKDTTDNKYLYVPQTKFVEYYINSIDGKFLNEDAKISNNNTSFNDILSLLVPNKNVVLQSDGSLTTSQGNAVSDFIPVTAGNSITISTAVPAKVICVVYDENKNVVDYYNVSSRTLTLPNNAAYLRISFSMDFLYTKEKVYVYDNTLSKYLFIPADLFGNFAKKTNEEIQKLDNDIYALHNTTGGYYLNSSGEPVENADYGYSDFIPIDIQNYPVTWSYGSGFSSSAKLVCYDAGKNVVNYYTRLGDQTNITFTSMSPNTIAYIRISVKLANAADTYVENHGIKYNAPWVGSDGLMERVRKLENKKGGFIKLTIAQFNEGHYAYGTGTGFPSQEAYLKAKDAYKNAISGLKADILFANEHMQELISGQTGNPSYDVFYKQFYPYKATTAGADYANWITIFSKFELKDVVTGTTPGSGQGGSGRKFLSAYVDINGRSVRLICFHPLPPADGGSVDAAYLVDLCANDNYVIAAADTNDVNGVWTDVFTDAGYQAGNHGFWGDIVTCYSGLPAYPQPIDNIFVKGFQMNSFCTFHQIYQCKTANNDSTFDLGKWTPVAIQDDRLPLKEHWEAGHQYAVGDFCYYPYPNSGTSSSDHYFITSDHQPVAADITTND